MAVLTLSCQKAPEGGHGAPPSGVSTGLFLRSRTGVATGLDCRGRAAGLAGADSELHQGVAGEVELR